MQENEFYLEATHKTPEITGNIEKGELRIKGKSIPEDARDFYFPFRNWVLEYVQTDHATLDIAIELEYFNTSTSSIILDIFKHLLKVSSEKKVNIKWIFEVDDLDMEEAGQDYQLMIGDIITLESKEPDF